MKRILMIVLVLAFPATTYSQEEAYVTARIMSADVAGKIARAAEQACRKMGYQVSVAVTDRFGNLLAFSRDALAGAHTIDVAQQKAYTAATFQGATIDLTKRLEFLKGTPNLSLVGGGVAVKIGGYMYGAVGVSGAPRDKQPGDRDHACALTGIKATQELLEFAG